jgi:GDP-4-dehydro-6-deoxy-D-mannose reductase
MSRVLVTGSTGFLGRFVVRECLADGHDVVGTFRTTTPRCDEGEDDASAGTEKSPTPSPALARSTYVCLDLTDAAGVSKTVAELRPQIVFHLAGQSSTTESWRDPATTYRDNVLAQVNLLEACCALESPPRVVVAGSSDEYGAPAAADNPISETQELSPNTPYGVTKAAQDLMARQYHLAQGLWTVVMRPFLQIGPGRSDRFFSGSFARQVAEIKLSKRLPVVEVGDIDQVRDMTDVRDVAAAFLGIAAHGEAGNAYNVASGRPVTMRHLLDLMLDAAGVVAEIRPRPQVHRRLEPRLLVGDSTKLNNATGWRPTIPLVESARDMIADRLERLRPGG